MVNAYVEFVKEFRKENPELSYKQAMVQASKEYKSKSGNVEMSITPKKKDRTKQIKQFKKLKTEIDNDLKEGKINGTSFLKFKKLGELLKGNSKTNVYHRHLQQVIRKLNTNKFAEIKKIIENAEKNKKELIGMLETQKVLKGQTKRTKTNEQQEKDDTRDNRKRKRIATKILEFKADGKNKGKDVPLVKIKRQVDKDLTREEELLSQLTAKPPTKASAAAAVSSGKVYANNPQNRKLGRVGQPYGGTGNAPAAPSAALLSTVISGSSALTLTANQKKQMKDFIDDYGTITDVDALFIKMGRPNKTILDATLKRIGKLTIKSSSAELADIEKLMEDLSDDLDDVRDRLKAKKKPPPVAPKPKPPVAPPAPPAPPVAPPTTPPTTPPVIPLTKAQKKAAKKAAAAKKKADAAAKKKADAAAKKIADAAKKAAKKPPVPSKTTDSELLKLEKQLKDIMDTLQQPSISAIDKDAIKLQADAIVKRIKERNDELSGKKSASAAVPFTPSAKSTQLINKLLFSSSSSTDLARDIIEKNIVGLKSKLVGKPRLALIKEGENLLEGIQETTRTKGADYFDDKPELKEAVDDISTFAQKLKSITEKHKITDIGNDLSLTTKSISFKPKQKITYSKLPQKEIDDEVSAASNLDEAKSIARRIMARKFQFNGDDYFYDEDIKNYEKQDGGASIQSVKDFINSHNFKSLDSKIKEAVIEEFDKNNSIDDVENMLEELESSKAFTTDDGDIIKVSKQDLEILEEFLTKLKTKVQGAGFDLNEDEYKHLGTLKGAGLVSELHKMISGNAKRVSGIDKEDVDIQKIANQTYKKDRRVQVGSFNYVSNESDEEKALYKNDETKQIIIAFRGSKVMKDLKTDLKLALGGIRKTERYASSKDYVDKIKTLYPDYTITLTGHSLGGTLAIQMSKDFGDKAVVFNAGHTPLSSSQETKDLPIKYYTKKGDIASMTGGRSYKDVRLVDTDDKNALEAHKMDNFEEVDNGGSLIGGAFNPEAEIAQAHQDDPDRHIQFQGQTMTPLEALQKLQLQNKMNAIAGDVASSGDLMKKEMTFGLGGSLVGGSLTDTIRKTLSGANDTVELGKKLYAAYKIATNLDDNAPKIDIMNYLKQAYYANKRRHKQKYGGSFLDHLFPSHFNL